MRFTKEIQEPAYRHEMTGYVLDPNSLTPGLEDVIRRDGGCEATVDGHAVELLPDVAVQLVNYTRHYWEFSWRNRDCSSFASACLNGRVPAGKSYGYIYDRVEGSDVVITGEPEYIPGAVWLTQKNHVPKTEDLKVRDGFHLLVGAVPENEDEAWYASKLGPDGPALLHTYMESVLYYPPNSAVQIASIRQEPKLPYTI